ncbi:protein kinase [Pendulispora brunnea]|uniref:Protein kinase n=1 Tax=Pendulispora brunnea TaxID=2905690 RepID=A0ABZ2JZK6_9BACT
MALSKYTRAGVVTIGPGCLEEGVILDFIQGQLSTPDFEEAEAHLARCTECRELVSTLARGLGTTSATNETGELRDVAFAPARQDARAAPVAPGELIAGKYRVERLLGHGGMGVVVAATHVHLGHKVALKFLHPGAMEASSRVVRFLREGRAAARIQGEHVARVMDVGTLDSGVPYIVMEFLQGLDFAALLAERGTLPIEEAIHYVLQACEAVAEAHALGIVHRDLKPANLFLSARPDGSPLVKVLDFGISKDGGAAAPQLTSGEVMMGSPRYMSPEQIMSPRDVDTRTDIWALGVILHELLAGSPPFDSDSAVGLSTLIVSHAAPKIRASRPDASHSLEAILLRCLEKERARRFSNVGELAEALHPFVRTGTAAASARVSVDRIVRLVHGGVVHPDAVPRGISIVPATASTRDAFSGTQPVAPPPKRRSTLGIAVVTAASLGLAAWAFIPSRAPPPTVEKVEKLSPPPEVAAVVETPHPAEVVAAVDAGPPPPKTPAHRTPAKVPKRPAPSAEPAPAQTPESDTNHSGLLDRK